MLLSGPDPPRHRRGRGIQQRRSVSWLAGAQLLVVPLAWARVRAALPGGDETAQAAADVVAPGRVADIEALVLRHQADVSEPDLGRAVLLEQIEPDLRALPLALVLDEAHPVVQDAPGDPLPGRAPSPGYG